MPRAESLSMLVSFRIGLATQRRSPTRHYTWPEVPDAQALLMSATGAVHTAMLGACATRLGNSFRRASPARKTRGVGERSLKPRDDAFACRRLLRADYDLCEGFLQDV